MSKKVESWAKESLKTFRDLSNSRLVFVGLAGTSKNQSYLTELRQSHKRQLQRYERLARMIEMAIDSDAWKSRTPTFKPLVFLTEFNNRIVEDWLCVGILLQFNIMCAPGVFVAKRDLVLERRSYYLGRVRQFKTNARSRQDKYGRRIKN